MHPYDETDEPTGYTGDRNQPPTMDRMADLLEAWDTVTDHPRSRGDYMDLASRLLDLDEEAAPTT